nr:DUF924 family protein [Pseudoroseomonas vastitatis]
MPATDLAALEACRQAVLNFWFPDGLSTMRPIWFQRDEEFDRQIRERFAALPDQALAGLLDPWMTTAEGSVALAVVLDQFPRNLFRGQPQAFQYDAKAREVARDAVLTRQYDQLLPPAARIFLYLPFEHSEDLAGQDRSVALFERLREHPEHSAPGGTIDYAHRHREVIQRFGRFPHRNQTLGRNSTADELDYLRRPGAGF